MREPLIPVDYCDARGCMKICRQPPNLTSWRAICRVRSWVAHPCRATGDAGTYGGNCRAGRQPVSMGQPASGWTDRSAGSRAAQRSHRPRADRRGNRGTLDQDIEPHCPRRGAAPSGRSPGRSVATLAVFQDRYTCALSPSAAGMTLAPAVLMCSAKLAVGVGRRGYLSDRGRSAYDFFCSPRLSTGSSSATGARRPPGPSPAGCPTSSRITSARARSSKTLTRSSQATTSSTRLLPLSGRVPCCLPSSAIGGSRSPTRKGGTA